jgi:lipid-A-disaccharide synthase
MARAIFISTGEASGDLYGALLARAIRRRDSRIPVAGFGGCGMAAAGARVDPGLGQAGVMGLTGAVRQALRMFGLLRRLKAEWRRRPPRALVLIDYPGFNLALGAMASALGIPVYYFVCPQVWAWGSGRLLTMRRVLRMAFPVLPFEEPLHQAFGIPSVFLGHPILDVIPRRFPPRREILRRAGFDSGRPLAVLLPGSRNMELERLLPLMLAAARAIARSRPDLQWAAVPAPGREDWLGARLAAAAPPVRVVADPGYALRSAACMAWTASGTSTLELGLLGVPQVAVYRWNRLNWEIAKRVVRIPSVVLVNLILGRRAVAELLQGDATGGNLVRESRLLLGPSAAARSRACAIELRERLGAPGAVDRVARELLRDLGRT